MTHLLAVLAFILTLTACVDQAAQPPAASARFPAISMQDAITMTGTSCGDIPADRSQFPRSGSIADFDGFAGHIVLVCSGSREIERLVFWSKTNEDFTNMVTRLTRLDGTLVTYTGNNFDSTTRITSFNFNHQGRSCEVIKPRTGISPSPLAVCG